VKRFEIERHVLRARLEAAEVDILLVLCTRMDADSGFIERRFSPSLKQLARWTGLHKSTVCRYLHRLEAGGWLIRHRTPIHIAREHHVTTRYEIRVPFFYVEASRSLPPELVAEDDAASRAARSELVAGSAEAGRAARHKSSETDRTQVVIRPDDDPLVDIARNELAAATGRNITSATAGEAVRLVLAGRRVEHPEQYLRASIREDPHRFLPSAGHQPPRFRDGQFIE
jgi:hypothetical protein